VVSLPHGYSHGRDGTRLTVANANPGVCINDITDHLLLDELSGTSAMNGVPVTVEAATRYPLRTKNAQNKTFCAPRPTNAYLSSRHSYSAIGAASRQESNYAL
jgi:hypothetical protein